MAPVAAAAAAHAAPAAAAPIAAAAAGAAAQAIAARPAGQVPAAKPEEAKRNLAYAQTQHHGAFAGAPQAANAAPAAPAAPAGAVPRTSPNLAASAVNTFDAHAETDPPDPIPPANNVTSELRDSDLEQAREAKYLPGDPMGPKTQPGAARAPMLRYDDSIPKFSRGGSSNEKKWLWITAGLIVVACLGLVIVLASRMGH
jgi:hypothetical protein